MTTVKSLKEGSDYDYVELQGRLRNDTLHIQGRGPKINREYGVAVDIMLSELSPKLLNWLRNLAGSLQSLAGTGKQYFVMQGAINEEERVHLQIAGNQFNTAYGATFDVDSDELAEFIRAEEVEEVTEIKDF